MKQLFEIDPTMEERFGQCPYATLSVQLKTLVENGLVEGKQYESIPPKVEYSLTKIGKKFYSVIETLQNWGQDYIEFLKTKNYRVQRKFCCIAKKMGQSCIS